MIETTTNTYEIASVPNGTDAAVDRALNEGYEGPIRSGEPEPAYVAAARAAYRHTIQELWDSGRVGVGRIQGGGIVLSYRGKTKKYRGASVEGCDYSDSFVISLAKQFRDAVDGPRLARHA